MPDGTRTHTTDVGIDVGLDVGFGRPSAQPPLHRRWAPRAVLLGVVAAVLTAQIVSQFAGPRVAVPVTTGVTAVVLAVAWSCRRRPRLRAATDPVLALAAISVMIAVGSAVSSIPAWSDWVTSVPVPVAFLSANALKLPAVAVLVVAAGARHWSRDGLLVRRGHPSARLTASGVLGRMRWSWVGPVVIVVVFVLFAIDPAVLAGVERDPAGAAVRIAVWLPLLLLGPIVNACAEELLFRHALITRGRPVLGVGGAVAVSALLFGIGHLGGNPGGVSGVLFTAAYGLVCAAAMLRCRGAVWNVGVHVFGDLAIVTGLLVAG